LSEFEYASVAVSVVLALGIADILRFFGDTVRDLDARKLYWVHTLWLLVLMKTHMDFWWIMWTFRDSVSIGPSLIYIMVGPALLFVATRTLLPGADDHGDMEVMFFTRKNAFFSLMILLSLWSTVSTPQAIEISTLLFTVVALVLSALCIAFDKRWLHSGVVVLVALVELIELSGLLATVS